MAQLTGKRIAFILTDGYEDAELTSPWQAVRDAGATPTLVSPATGQIAGKKGHRQDVDAHPAAEDAAGYDALVIPGGVVNADHLRIDEPSQGFVRAFFDQGKPVGVICHGAWILIEAGAVAGRTLTSYPTLATDLSNAGAHWVDQDVVTDRGLTSSRRPADLPAFNARLIREIAESGRHWEFQGTDGIRAATT